MTQTETTFTVIGQPRIKREYSDEWETTMVIDVRRNDGVEGDVWIVAGVPDYLQGTAAACGSEQGLLDVRVFGDSPDCWCPASLDPADMDAILEAVSAVALATHKARGNENDDEE